MTGKRVWGKDRRYLDSLPVPSTSDSLRFRISSLEGEGCDGWLPWRTDGGFDDFSVDLGDTNTVKSVMDGDLDVLPRPISDCR